jgi:hypothetical protein
MLFTGWEGRTEKYFPEVSDPAEGRGTLPRPRENIFSTDRPKRVNNVFIFCLMFLGYE